MKFKKGDLVRVIEAGNQLTHGDIHIVQGISRLSHTAAASYVNLKPYNRTNVMNGFYPWRFKKVKKGDLTPSEVHKYTVFKLKGE